MKTIKVGVVTLPIENIDYLHEGDGTAYTKAQIVLKSGIRISIEGWSDVAKLKAVMSDNLLDQEL